MRGTARLTDVVINTVVKLLCEAGKACSDYQDKVFRKFSCGKSATINAVTASNPKAAFALIAQNYAVRASEFARKGFLARNR